MQTMNETKSTHQRNKNSESDRDESLANPTADLNMQKQQQPQPRQQKRHLLDTAGLPERTKKQKISHYPQDETEHTAVTPPLLSPSDPTSEYQLANGSGYSRHPFHQYTEDTSLSTGEVEQDLNASEVEPGISNDHLLLNIGTGLDLDQPLPPIPAFADSDEGYAGSIRRRS